MYKKMKLPVLLMIIMMLCLSPGIASAQSCDQAFLAARDQYYNGQYESVQNLLLPCTTDFFTYRKEYIADNQIQVFRVYKLLITAYYDSDYDYLAEEKKQQLINFFAGVYSPEDVLYNLNNTAF